MKRAAFVLVVIASLFGMSTAVFAQSDNASPCAAGQPPGRPPGTPPGPPDSTPVGRPTQYPPRSECAMRLSTSVGTRGSSFTAAGEGLRPGSTVTVSMASARLGSTTADSSGAFSVGVTVPEDAAVGRTTVTATDGVSVLSAGFEVRAAVTSREGTRSLAGVALPRTGVETTLLVVAALALIGIGTAAVLAARRRLVTTP